jgi:hypothetical protein
VIRAGRRSICRKNALKLIAWRTIAAIMRDFAWAAGGLQLLQSPRRGVPNRVSRKAQASKWGISPIEGEFEISNELFPSRFVKNKRKHSDNMNLAKVNHHWR